MSKSKILLISFFCIFSFANGMISSETSDDSLGSSTNSGPSSGEIDPGAIYTLGAFSVNIGQFSQAGSKAEDEIAVAGQDDNMAYAAVLDGHGGSKVSSKAALGNEDEGEPNLLGTICAQYEEGVDFSEAIKKGFIAFDARMQKYKEQGSTATAAFIDTENLTVAYVGDSRCVLKTTNGDLIETQDHSPKIEKKRIESEQGVVFEWPENSGTYRLQAGLGFLAVSRSLGDYTRTGEKPAGLSASPDILVKPVTECDFLIIASDGLWDNVTTEEAVTAVTAFLKAGDTTTTAAKKLAGISILKDMSTKGKQHDDISVIVIKINHKN